MTNRYYWATLVAGLLFAASCRQIDRDPRSHIPVVQTIAATAQPDGSVIVKGVVVSAGRSDIYYAGFCMDTLPGPAIMSNQQQVQSLTAGDTFVCQYNGLDPFTKYYFRAWAANDQAYAHGADVYLLGTAIDTMLIPCRLAAQSISYTGKYSIGADHFTHIEKIAQLGAGSTIYAYTNYHSISLEFGSKAMQGFYQTAEIASAEGNFVVMSFDGIVIQAGTKVYVTQPTANTVEVTVCDAQVFMPHYSLWYSMATRFQAAF